MEINELGYASWDEEQFHDERLQRLAFHLQRQLNGTQQVTLSDQSAQPLIDINLPAALAQRWQVTLLAWQANTVPPSPTSTANIDDFQLRNFCATLNLKLQIQYGTDRATETAQLDYPANGLTFEVNAARLALNVMKQSQPVIGQYIFPQVGAFATPMVGRSKGKVLPTFTSATEQVASTATRIFAAPPRAIGYRVYTSESAAFTVDVDETDYLGNALVRDYTAASLLRAPNGSMPATDWTALAARALALKVKNNDGATTRSIQVAWVLDLA